MTNRPESEKIMSKVKINSIHFEKAFTTPGESASWTVVITSTSKEPVSGNLVCEINFLDQSLKTIQQDITLHEGEQSFAFDWQPPQETPRGYGLDVTLKLADGSTVATVSSGFDVLKTWTQMPRYGFLTDFFPGRTDTAQTMQTLSDYHINGLQFYDWMYRHEQLLTDTEPYVDILDRTLSLVTVKELIDTAHEHGIAAMPYTAIYGASVEYFNAHKDMGMYHADGSPVYLGKDFMAYMDPRPDSKWTLHLMDEFKSVLQTTRFDGIHLDQYGDPKVGYDAEGNYFDLGQAIADTITKTHTLVDQYRMDGAVVFNCVTNWPVELASQADEDIIYIEVWDPYSYFSDLHNLITYAQSQNTGKPVVLAAYVHPANSANPLLMDAIIFASGGGHIELGENVGYLSEAYFPKYDELSLEQKQLMQNYYDFAVRYQNLIGPDTSEATGKWIANVKVGDLHVGLEQGNDVFTLARESQGVLALSLINLTGIKSSKWNEPVDFPKVAENIPVSIAGFSKEVKAVYLASPDLEEFALEPLEFEQTNDEITLTLPILNIWDLLVFKY